MNFFFARDAFSVVVPHSVPNMMARLDAAIAPSQPRPRSAAPAYHGMVSESGFVLRRVAAHPKDSRAAVVARGAFEPTDGATTVNVIVRHRFYMRAFGWLLLLLACAGTAASIDYKAWAVGAAMAGFAILWQFRLCRDVQQVGNEVRAYLTS